MPEVTTSLGRHMDQIQIFTIIKGQNVHGVDTRLFQTTLAFMQAPRTNAQPSTSQNPSYI